MVLPLNEAILDSIIGPDKICEELHHKSYFLPELSRIENSKFHVILSEGVVQPIKLIPKEEVFTKGNMANIFTTILINISTKLGIMENVCIGTKYSPK